MVLRVAVFSAVRIKRGNTEPNRRNEKKKNRTKDENATTLYTATLVAEKLIDL